MDPQHEHSPEQQARRHLLKLASYVPPAILGAMMIGPGVVLGDDYGGKKGGKGGKKNCGNGSIYVSAGGSACCPCVKSSPQYNPTTCNYKKCQMGDCSACSQLVFGDRDQCKQATRNCSSCSCTRIGHGQNQFWVCQ